MLFFVHFLVLSSSFFLVPHFVCITSVFILRSFVIVFRFFLLNSVSCACTKINCWAKGGTRWDGADDVAGRVTNKAGNEFWAQQTVVAPNYLDYPTLSAVFSSAK